LPQGQRNMTMQELSARRWLQWWCQPSATTRLY